MTARADDTVFPRWDALHPGEKIIVWASGGKDSLAVLALAARALGPDRIVPVFRYLVDNMRCVETPIRAQLNLLGIAHPLVKVPSVATLNFLRLGIYTTTQVTKDTRQVKFVDVEALARKRTGLTWTAGGEKQIDTVHRRLWLRSFDGIDEKSKRLYPVHLWTHKQVRALCKTLRAPLSPTFGSDGNVTGLGFEAMDELKTRYPDDYKRFCDAFPFAEARRQRDRIYGRRPRSAAEARQLEAARQRPKPVSDGRGPDDPA